jgi:hypothetical protein
MDSIPNELLELKARFDQWRANRKTRSEPIPDELRSEALEMTKRFSSTLLLKVLKVQVWHLKNRTGTKRSARAAAPRSSKAAFFKLPQPATLAPAESLTSQTSTDYRLQLERPDGSRLTLTLPSLDATALNALCADFLRGSSR